jgi:hypothetical protein
MTKPDHPPNYDDYIAAARARVPSARALEQIIERIEGGAPVAPAPSPLRAVGWGVASIGAITVAVLITMVWRQGSTTPVTPSEIEKRSPVVVPPSSERLGEPANFPDGAPEIQERETSPPHVPSRPRRTHARSNSGATRAESESGQSSEIALIEAAEGMLSGAPRESLRLTAEHARLFPEGRFSQEREVIAIDALARLGNIDGARARAENFRRMHAGSAYARRVERILSRESPGEGAPQ